MPEIIKNLSKLCVHTQTNRPWNLDQCVRYYSEAGIHAISIWRHLLDGASLSAARSLLIEHEMDVVSLVRGGFLASTEKLAREAAIDDNLTAIDQAAAIGAPLLVLVCGSDPGQSLELSREQIREGIMKIIPYAKNAGIKLAIEPLHPMYAADRSAITTMAQANETVEQINDESLGVAVDVFHLWWDPDLESEIKRCGRDGNLFAFHVCDWNVPLQDMLNDRGLMGDGCIDVKQIRGWVEEAGFRGYREVEVFSNKYWAMDQIEYLERIKYAYLNHT
jgi:sugar phosphate isomerase/epimerase